jgi:hypothetical protein
MTARNAPLAIANVRGKFDVDALDLAVERFVVTLDVKRGVRQEQLPPVLQEALAQYGVQGSLSIGGEAHVPFADTESASYSAVLDLPNASAQLAGSRERVDRVAMKLRVASGERDAANWEIERAVAMADTGAAATRPSTRPMLAPPTTTAQATSRPTTVAATRPRPRRPQPPSVVKLETLEVISGDTAFRAANAEATVDWERGQWRANNLDCRLEVGEDRTGLPSKIEQALAKFGLGGKVRLTATAAGPLTPLPGIRLADQLEFQAVAYPRDMTVRPPKWDKPFTHVSGTVKANKDVVSFENVEGRFGADRVFVDSARIPLAGIETTFRIEEIVGSAELTGTVEDWPKPFEFVSKQLRPSGKWYALGSFARRKGLQPGEKPEFRFDVRSENAGAQLGPNRLALTDVKAEMTLGPLLVDVKRVDADALGGHVTAEGQFTPGKGKDLQYQGAAWVRDVDLRALAKQLAKRDQEPPRKLSGKGNMNVTVTGTGPDEGRPFDDDLRAAGRFEVLDGDFWNGPVIDAVTGVAKVKHDALTVGQAAGTFELRDRIVTLKDAAISSPVLGIQGEGTVALDGALNLKVVAAPLADWRDQAKRTKIPIVSDVAGELLGGLQKILSAANKTLLYEMRVTGTAKAPKVETVPAPVLTEGLAKLFGGMLKGDKITGTLEERKK